MYLRSENSVMATAKALWSLGERATLRSVTGSVLTTLATAITHSIKSGGVLTFWAIKSEVLLPCWAIDFGQDQLLETKDGHPIRKASWQTV